MTQERLAPVIAALVVRDAAGAIFGLLKGVVENYGENSWDTFKAALKSAGWSAANTSLLGGLWIYLKI